jgi:hypothetical protein
MSCLRFPFYSDVHIFGLVAPGIFFELKKCFVVLKISKNWFLPVTTVFKNKRTVQRTTYPELPTCFLVLSRNPLVLYKFLKT